MFTPGRPDIDSATHWAHASVVSREEAPSLGDVAGHCGYPSIRRSIEIVDRVSRDGERLTVKALARDLGVSRSTCYHLVNVLIDEGYVERIPRRGGYRLGPTLEMLSARSRRSRMQAVGHALCDLAHVSGRVAYFAVLSKGDEVLIIEMRAPPNGPPVGLSAGFFGPGHALALGKVLIAAGGSRAIHGYIERHELPAFTDRTITDPEVLSDHLLEISARGYATEFEEFAANLCCVAVPVSDERGRCSGAVGLGTTMSSRAHELGRMIGLARRASRTIATALRGDGPRPTVIG